MTMEWVKFGALFFLARRIAMHQRNGTAPGGEEGWAITGLMGLTAYGMLKKVG